jgi:peptidoglycan hydrolase-like protein with peptidoglycan-binding domain
MDWKRHFQTLSEKDSEASFSGEGDFGADPSTIAAVQTKLNTLGIQPPLTVDGTMGPMTTSAIKAFQSSKGLTVDGVIGPQTLGALGIQIPGSVTSKPSPSGTSSGTIAAVRGIEKLDQAELKALVDAANWIGINPDWLASAISFESGFSTSIANAAGSGAVGLIQFMPSTAAGLGTSTAALKQMSFTQQLEYVKKYFAPYQGKLTSLEDTYLAIFYPAFIGKANDAVLGSTGSAIYNQNAGFDKTHKGYVTKEDITSTIRGVLASAAGRIPVAGMAVTGIVLASIGTWLVGGILTLGGLALYEIFKRK